MGRASPTVLRAMASDDIAISSCLAPGPQVFRSVGCSARCNGVTTHQMREVRTKMSICDGSGNSVAVHAGSRLKDAAAFHNRVTRDGRLFLLLDPVVELFRRIHINPQQHFGVLDAAILRALTEINSGLLGIDPGVIHSVRNQVRLSSKTRHPKAVVRVSGKKSEKSGSRTRRVANRNMQLVGGDNSQSRIAKFPPELVADGDDLDRAWRLRCVLDGMDHACRGEEKHQYDEYWNHRPG